MRRSSLAEGQVKGKRELLVCVRCCREQSTHCRMFWQARRADLSPPEPGGLACPHRTCAAPHIVPPPSGCSSPHPLAPPATPSRCPAGRAGVRCGAGVGMSCREGRSAAAERGQVCPHRTPFAPSGDATRGRETASPTRRPPSRTPAGSLRGMPPLGRAPAGTCGHPPTVARFASGGNHPSGRTRRCTPKRSLTRLQPLRVVRNDAGDPPEALRPSGTQKGLPHQEPLR